MAAVGLAAADERDFEGEAELGLVIQNSKF